MLAVAGFSVELVAGGVAATAAVLAVSGLWPPGD